MNKIHLIGLSLLSGCMMPTESTCYSTLSYSYICAEYATEARPVFNSVEQAQEYEQLRRDVEILVKANKSKAAANQVLLDALLLVNDGV